MFQVALTLPVKQHNGTSNLPAIRKIQYALAYWFGGYSSAPISGGWIDDETGDLYEDESLLVWTNVRTQEDINTVLEAAPAWAVWLQQIKLQVTVSPVEVALVSGTRAQAASTARQAV